jgi:hypothetical protein
VLENVEGPAGQKSVRERASRALLHFADALCAGEFILIAREWLCRREFLLFANVLE